VYNEKELVSRILNEDLRAFELLVKQYEKLVFHVVGRMVRDEDDKQDVAQEVFMKVHRNLGTFQFNSKLSTWIARIAYLSAINFIKKNKRNSDTEALDTVENFHFTRESPDKVMEKKELSDYVNRLIEMMPDNFRIVITLYHLNEFSYQEIEDITGMPEGTIKSYLFRGRKLLKEKLEVYLKKEVS
jgi:RNA polymerase sigma factor (sigma-70 family)